LKTNSQQAQDRAEAAFKKKEMQAREGEKAMAEYRAERLALRERTARLRELRLARDAADTAARSAEADAQRRRDSTSRRRGESLPRT
jgi:hypothetical protein